MGQYGIKIKNIQAASIYEYEHGFRTQLDTTKAMLVNSLFLDYLLENNLIRTWNEKSTRDVICLEFSYGTSDYKHMKAKISKFDDNDQKKTILENIEKNKEQCIKISKDQLRVKYYTEGVSITYKIFKKGGEEIVDKRETIKTREWEITKSRAVW